MLLALFNNFLWINTKILVLFSLFLLSSSRANDDALNDTRAPEATLRLMDNLTNSRKQNILCPASYHPEALKDTVPFEKKYYNVHTKKPRLPHPPSLQGKCSPDATKDMVGLLNLVTRRHRNVGNNYVKKRKTLDPTNDKGSVASSTLEKKEWWLQAKKPRLHLELPPQSTFTPEATSAMNNLLSLIADGKI